MHDLIAQVIQARAQATALKEQLVQAYAEWSAAHRELTEATEEAGLRQTEAEKRLRDAALDIYKVTGDKHPAPGVEVKMGSKLVYEPAEAYAWAREHAMCLNLDKKAFEKVAMASPIPCVTIEKAPFVTLAAQLEEAK